LDQSQELCRAEFGETHGELVLNFVAPNVASASLSVCIAKHIRNEAQDDVLEPSKELIETANVKLFELCSSIELIIEQELSGLNYNLSEPKTN